MRTWFEVIPLEKIIYKEESDEESQKGIAARRVVFCRDRSAQQ
jgi:hypothetical protein